MTMQANARRPPAPRTGEQAMTPRATQGRYRRHLDDNKTKLLGLYIVSFLLISIVYTMYTSRVWSYMGLNLFINSAKVVVSLIVLAIFVGFTPVSWTARTFFLNIMLTAYLLPSLVLFGFSNKPVSSAVLIWASVAVVYCVSAIQFPVIRLLPLSYKIVMWILLGISLLLVSTFIFIGGVGHFNLDFSKVYSIREDAADSMPDILLYLSSTLINAIIPFGIAMSMHYRMYLNTALFVFISILMFGLTGHKIMFFTPLFVAGAFLLLSLRLKHSTILSGFAGLVAVVAVSVVLDNYIGNQFLLVWLEDLFIRRILLIPTMLDYAYIDFFSNNAQYYWSTSKITFGMLEVPHGGVSPPEMIGYAHFGSTASWADTGFIGSGFAQAGVLGSIVYAIATGAVIGVFQSYSRQMGVPLIASATLGLFTTMIQSSDFVSLFLTHGLFLALIILALVGDDDAAPGGFRRAARRSGSGGPPPRRGP